MEGFSEVPRAQQVPSAEFFDVVFGCPANPLYDISMHGCCEEIVEFATLGMVVLNEVVINVGDRTGVVRMPRL